MSSGNTTKINRLLRDWPLGTVGLSSWILERGVSSQLLNRYKQNNWLESIGTGAVIRSGDQVNYQGGLYALQTQANSSVHVGGRTALSLVGRGHYLDLGTSGRVVLFGGSSERLPPWFRKRDWGVKIDYFSTSFLPPDVGLVELSLPNFSIKISSAARAMLECLYLAPKHQELFECYELMESLNNLRPNVVQELLEACSSIKVKRLFLYFAELARHPWIGLLDLSRVDLGSGKRSLVKHGVYIDKYKITVPEELTKIDKPEL